MRYLFAVSFVLILSLFPWLAFNYPNSLISLSNIVTDTGDQLASIIVSHNPKTIAGLQSKYNTNINRPDNRIKILIVPGHEPHYGGAEYKDLLERDMTVVVAKYLDQFMQKNGRYNVAITRDNQNWDPAFDNYFKTKWKEIIDWKDAYRHDAKLVSINQPAVHSGVIHNSAREDVAIRLYGITKWANENDIDVAIHIHFNDNPGHKYNMPGKYSGFSIYIPEQQYSNSTTTRAIAETIFKRLAKYNPVSNFPGETEGLVEEPDLIAIGADNTSNAASMLIEYSYIYEQQFANPETRDLALKDLAYQTYLGLQDFFDPTNASNLSKSYDTLTIPYSFNNQIASQDNKPADVFALQTALLLDGVYPPQKSSKNDCPRTGKFGPCTKQSLGSFQEKHNIIGESGIVGEKTREVLNKLYSGAKI